MNGPPHQPSLSTAGGPDPAPFDWPLSVFWLVGTLAMSLAVAWFASRIEPYFAPLLVYPVLVGAVLGASMVGLMYACGRVGRRIAALGIVVGVAAVVVGQHYFAYLRTRHQFDQQFDRLQQTPLDLGQLAQIGLPAPPESLLDFLRQTAEQGRPLAGYMARGWVVWLWWGLEAALTLVAAAVPVWMTLRRPISQSP